MAVKRFSNWNFSDITYKDTQYLTHCFHPYPAKFIPQIPRRLIELYAPRRDDKILDPFCGSGTTLVEAKLMGRPSIGVDTNPLAIMISKSKVSPIKKEQLEKFILWLDNWTRKELKALHPHKIYFNDDRVWFREDVLGQIDLILEKLKEMYDSDTRNFVKVAFSSILKGVSNARMDRIVPNLPKEPIYVDHKHYNRIVDNEKRNLNLFARLSSRLKLMHSRLQVFLTTASTAKAVACLGDARELGKISSDFLREGKIKLVITSPPYWSAFNYGKIHQLSLNLFNLRRTSLEAEIGRGNFLMQMERVYEQISKYLVENGIFCLIIGRTKSRINRRLADLGCKYNMPLCERFTRRIRNHSFFVKSIKSEEVLVFQKH
jgi:site-specific DNA-methyltransferase (cytosine-N4-specific)